jgi:hypothetical protein
MNEGAKVSKTAPGSLLFWRLVSVSISHVNIAARETGDAMLEMQHAADVDLCYQQPFDYIVETPASIITVRFVHTKPDGADDKLR